MFSNRKIKNLFERYTGWTDHLLLVLTIFTCTFFVYRDFGFRMIFGYAILCVILGIHLLRRILLKIPPTFSSFKASYFLIAALILIAFVLPGSRQDEDTIAYMISMVVCGGYLLCASPSEKEIMLSKKVVVIAAAVFGLLIVFFRLFPNLYWDTVYKIISEPSRELAAYYIPKGYGIPIGGSYTFADYVMTLAALLMCGHAFSRTETKKGRICSLLMVAFFMLCILLVGRRGEFIAAVAMIMIVSLIYCRIKFQKRHLFILLGAIAALVMLIICCWPLFEKIPFLHRYIRTFEKLLSGADITSGRLELWNMAWLLFLKNPVFGIGWGGFADHVSEGFRALHGQDVMDVHNTYLQLLCETGIVGTVLILTPIIFCLVQTVRQAYRLKKTQTDHTLLFVMNMTSLGLQVYFLLLGMLDPCFYKLIYWAFYAIALLLLISAKKGEGLNMEDPIDALIRRYLLKGKKKDQ